jgi:hypothetical protein
VSSGASKVYEIAEKSLRKLLGMENVSAVTLHRVGSRIGVRSGIDVVNSRPDPDGSSRPDPDLTPRA